MHDDIARAVAARTPERAIQLLLEGSPPRARLGRAKETDLWDYKADCPGPARDERSENAWANIAADVVAFHNHRGGLLIFGIDDHSYQFVGATRSLDSKKFNDRIRRYVGDSIWIDFHREFIQPDQRYLGVATIPPRGPSVLRFKADAPTINEKRKFLQGGTAIRQGDSSFVYDPIEADRFARSQSAPMFGNKYQVDEPFYRVLAPDYLEFLGRGGLGHKIETSMRDPRVAVTSLIGVGGMGKTALATWAVNRAYETGEYQFIVSTTAKDRELSSTGILGLQSHLSSYDDLLNQIVDVLGFPEIKSADKQEKEREVKDLLTNNAGLLYVDNLETVDDKRLIDFLDDLPLGVRAVVTSRRNSVRTASRPIEIPPLDRSEIIRFVRLLGAESPYSHVAGMADGEALKLGEAWDGIPLALRWAISRTKDTSELLREAEVPTANRLEGDQLLEFSFRRVFDKLTPAERAVLETLSVLEQPMPTEALVAGAGATDAQVLDAVEELTDDVLVQRVFDPDRNDYCFTILPITRAFTRTDLQRRPNISRAIQLRLSNWYNATDVDNEADRVVVREVRSGRNTDDTAVVDLAQAAERRGDDSAAKKLYDQATSRNPRSWRGSRLAAEFYRHKVQDKMEALRLYSVAAANAPKQGPERALIFREWGLLLRDSGQPDATKRAEEKLAIALQCAPRDDITRYALATCLDKRGSYHEVVQVLEPLASTDNVKTQQRVRPLLLKAYDRTSQIVKAAQLRAL